MSDRYVVFENFKWGLDSRKSVLTTQPGALLQIDNAHINNGGEIEQRKSLFRDGTAYPNWTFGLEATDTGLVTFGSRPTATFSTTRSRTSNVATVGITTLINSRIQIGDVVTITGLGGVGYNGTVTVLTVSSTQITFASVGPDEGVTVDVLGVITFTINLPAGVSYQVLVHPTGFRCSAPGVFVTCDMTEVVFSCNFRGKAFVIAKFEDNNSFLYYDGLIVLDSRNGLVLCRSTGPETPRALAQDLTLNLSDFTDWIVQPNVDENGVQFDGSVIIQTPVGTHIAMTPSVTSLNGILGVELIDQNNPGIAGVAAQVTFTLNAGTNGIVAVSAPMVADGTNIQPLTPTATIAWAGSLALTANAVRDAINSLTSAHGYSASTSGATITVVAPTSFGNVIYSLVVTTTGDITATLGGGPPAVGGFALTLTPNGISITIHTSFHTNPNRIVKVSTVNQVGAPTFNWQECNSDGSTPVTVASGIVMAVSGTNSTATATSVTFLDRLNSPGSISGYFKCTATSAGANPANVTVVFSVNIKMVSP